MSGLGSSMSAPPRSVRITGWGCYAPERVLTNADLERLVDTSDEWIQTRTGIRERRVAAPHETTATLAAIAAKRAVAVAGLEPDDIDLIIVATLTPDYPMPSTAVLVKEAIGNRTRGGVRPRRGVLGLRLRLRDRGCLRPFAGWRVMSWSSEPSCSRASSTSATGARASSSATARVRSSVRLGRGGRRPRRRRADDRPGRRLHDLAALGRLEEPLVARDDRARRALHPHGGPRDVPLRDPHARLVRARGDREGRAGDPTRSTSSSRIRRTSVSSRRSRRGSGSRWRRCS